MRLLIGVIVGSQKDIYLREDQHPAEHKQKEEEYVSDALAEELDHHGELIVGSQVEQDLEADNEDDDHVEEGHRHINTIIVDLTRIRLRLIIRNGILGTLNPQNAVKYLQDHSAHLRDVEDVLEVLDAVRSQLYNFLSPDGQLNEEAPVIEADNEPGILRVLLEDHGYQEKDDVDVELEVENLLRFLVLVVDEIAEHFLSVGVVGGLFAKLFEEERQFILRHFDILAKAVLVVIAPPDDALDVVDLVLEDLLAEVEDGTFDEVVPLYEVAVLELFFHRLLDELIYRLQQMLLIILLHIHLQLLGAEFGHTLYHLLRNIHGILIHVLVDSALALLEEVIVVGVDLFFAGNDIDAPGEQMELRLDLVFVGRLVEYFVED